MLTPCRKAKARARRGKARASRARAKIAASSAIRRGTAIRPRGGERERERRAKERDGGPAAFEGYCYECGGYGHSARFCPTTGKGKGPGKGKGKGIYDVEADSFDPCASWGWGKSGMTLGNSADKEDLDISLIERDVNIVTHKGADEAHVVADWGPKGADKVHEGADKGHKCADKVHEAADKGPRTRALRPIYP